eukprot:2995286-Rhodomonas_salina.1
MRGVTNVCKEQVQHIFKFQLACIVLDYVDEFSVWNVWAEVRPQQAAEQGMACLRDLLTVHRPSRCPIERQAHRSRSPQVIPEFAQ